MNVGVGKIDSIGRRRRTDEDSFAKEKKNVLFSFF